MRPLKILTWHTHGSYLLYLTQVPHEFYVLSKPDRPPGYAGRSGLKAAALASPKLRSVTGGKGTTKTSKKKARK